MRWENARNDTDQGDATDGTGNSQRPAGEGRPARTVGDCAWCGREITAHGADPSGDYITWHRHTGDTVVYCTLHHLHKDFGEYTGEDIATDAAVTIDAGAAAISGVFR